MADSFPFPTAGAPVAAPIAAPVAEVTTATDVLGTVPAGKKERKKQVAGERKKPAAAMTPEQISQVSALIPTMSYNDIANKLGITKFQVNRVLMDLKKKLRESAADDADKLAKVNAYIESHLSRPEDTRPGGGAREGKVSKALDDIVGNILNGL